MFFFKKKKESECKPIEGGEFRVSYISDGQEIYFTHVHIDSRDEDFDNLYIPKKEGFTFDGWYFDSTYQNKVGVVNSKDLPRTPIYDQNNCHIGYKDITLYAKWIKNE
jgi:uncharacterized repeat protein (TIGR02543 family)